jgi:dCTP deaminase
MATLSGSQISRLVHAEELVIDPFEDELVQPASYDLRLGERLLASPLSPDIPGMVIELNEKSPTYRIQSGQMIAAISAERLELPLHICGSFGIRSGFARRGLIAFGGPQLDPGFKGRLTLNLLNVGPEPIGVTTSDPLFSVVFQMLDEPAETGYDGVYQGQEDFPQEQYDFILTARTTSLAEIPTLRQQVARLSVLIEELDEKLPDPDDGWELKPEVERRLRESLERSGDSLLSVIEVRKNLGI